MRQLMFSIFKREKLEKMPAEEKDQRVLAEIGEVQKCVEQGDNKCTVKHLSEARKYEECPPCRRQITRFMKEATYIPKEKQVVKTQRLREYIEGAGPLHKKWVEMEKIRPTKRTKLAGKTRNTLKSTGHGLKVAGRGVKRGIGWLKKQVQRKEKRVK